MKDLIIRTSNSGDLFSRMNGRYLSDYFIPEKSKKKEVEKI